MPTLVVILQQGDVFRRLGNIEVCSGICIHYVLTHTLCTIFSNALMFIRFDTQHT
jgi:hypothetical protein